MQASDLKIESLGKCQFPSPFQDPTHHCVFISDTSQVAFDPSIQSIHQLTKQKKEIPSLEIAGARSNIFFDPKKTKIAIVTCGGLCPGLNDVVRSIVMTAHYHYDIPEILGIRYGYRGFLPESEKPLQLTPEFVARIHKRGGTILGSSRGGKDLGKVIEFIEKNKINILFTVGGDGTLRGAMDIANAAKEKGLPLSVIGIPKTIDNDILYIDESFGFKTAFAEAAKSIASAHTEAQGTPNGIGLVKLMGRHSGFIACHAALSMNDVNFVLIPEVPFNLEGPSGFLEAIETRLNNKKSTVIVAAEGAGQEYVQESAQGTDASGNLKLGDIGSFLKHKITSHFAEKGKSVDVKYIDPSYNIRSVPSLPSDSEYALRLATNAVHAGMAGKTNLVVAKRHERYVHIPMSLVASGRKHVDPCGELWNAVLQATGQPTSFEKQRGH